MVYFSVWLKLIWLITLWVNEIYLLDKIYQNMLIFWYNINIIKIIYFAHKIVKDEEHANMEIVIAIALILMRIAL